MSDSRACFVCGNDVPEVETTRILCGRCNSLISAGHHIHDRCAEALEKVIDEVERLRTCIEQIAQVRAVCGSAQGSFRHTLRMCDAVLAGADLRQLETVEAVAAGTWKPEATT